LSTNTVIASGQFTATIVHPLYNDGVATAFDGFKLEGQLVQAEQLMDSSKVIALANGNTVTITNNNGAGALTFNVTRTGTSQDMITIANTIRNAGDSVGGTISITQEINGTVETTTFYGCTVANCPPLIIAGNDAPDYSVKWNYGSYSTGTNTTQE
jgi:hypothetical protein